MIKPFLSIFASFISISLCVLSGCTASGNKTPKVVFIIVDGIPADVIEKLDPSNLHEISGVGGFTRAHVGGDSGTISETPTISAVGYNSLLTGTWVNKHNVWDNDIKDPNYHYWNLFRLAEKANLATAVFSSWTDNRTKLVGEGLDAAGSIKLDYKFDGLELDTVKFPHDAESAYMHAIDEAVASEAAKVIADNGPDLSWVYLEFTDDMGHRYGDSQQYYDAIQMADKQIGKIWSALKERAQKSNEDWLIVVTTDHGRDAKTGRGHGGQSSRERSTWIVTNSTNLNDRFHQNPGIVDIMPSICNHLNLPVPDSVRQEIDGVPFIGPVDLADLHIKREGDQLSVTWKSLGKEKSEKVEILVTSTNHFKEGGLDTYQKVGEAELGVERFSLPVGSGTLLYKVLVKTKGQWATVTMI